MTDWKNTDHDLLIRIDEKITGLERDIKHNTSQHKEDILLFRKEIKEDIVAPLVNRMNDIEKKNQTTDGRVDKIEDRFLKWGGFIMGVGMVIQIVWFLVQGKISDVFGL